MTPWNDDWPEGALDLGHDHWATWSTYSKVNHPTSPDPAGIIIWHRPADGADDEEDWCHGGVYWWRPENAEPLWDLISLDPLTISPSVHCVLDKGGCGDHGFIRDGRWQPA